MLKNDSDFQISVVIPAYNSAAFIADSLESVFNQVWKPQEVIVVDDGSTDDTASVVKSLAPPSGVELVLLQQKNSGPSAARNHGVRAANGQWIAFLDADDLWYPERLAKQVDYLKNHPDTGLVFGDMSVFDHKEEQVNSAFKKFGMPHCNSNGYFENALESLLKRNPIPTSTVLARKDAVINAGYFDEKLWYGEDYDLWLRLALSVTFACVPAVLLQKRLLGGNLSENEEKFYCSKFYILKKLYREIDPGSRYKKSIQRTFLKESKQFSYFYYVNGLYLLSVMAYVRFLLSWCRLKAFNKII